MRRQPLPRGVLLGRGQCLCAMVETTASPADQHCIVSPFSPVVRKRWSLLVIKHTL